MGTEEQVIDAPTICDKCSSRIIRSIDVGEVVCAMCGWRKYLALGRLDKRPFKLQVRYKGTIRRDKRTPLTIGIKNGREGEPNRVMKYRVHCPECLEITEQGQRLRRNNNNGFHYEIKMKCRTGHTTTLMESSHTGELFGWR